MNSDKIFMFARLTGTYFLTLETRHCRKIEAAELRSHFLTLQKNLVLTCCCFTFICESLSDKCYISHCDCQISISCGSLSSCLGPFQPGATRDHPNPSLLSREVKVRKNKNFHHKRKDPVFIFTCQATACKNAFPTYPLLKPASRAFFPVKH